MAPRDVIAGVSDPRGGISEDKPFAVKSKALLSLWRSHGYCNHLATLRKNFLQKSRK